MIFYGTNASKLKNGRLSNVTCPNCNTQTSMNYSVFGKYFYIYWIPFFPIGKTNVLECNHCKKTYKLKELPEQIKHKFELEKHKGIPLKHFIGLGIIALIIAGVSYSTAKDKEHEAAYIKAPKIGDKYRTSGDTNNYYTIGKVTSISNDSIFVIFNNYQTNKKSDVKNLDKGENYEMDNVEGYTIKEVQQLYEEGVIYQIDRD